MKAVTLHEHVEWLQRKYGGLRAAARAVGVGPGYLLRLRDGYYQFPTDRSLERIGLRREISYYRL